MICNETFGSQISFIWITKWLQKHSHLMIFWVLVFFSSFLSIGLFYNAMKFINIITLSKITNILLFLKIKTALRNMFWSCFVTNSKHIFNFSFVTDNKWKKERKKKKERRKERKKQVRKRKEEGSKQRKVIINIWMLSPVLFCRLCLFLSEGRNRRCRSFFFAQRNIHSKWF